MKKICRNIVKGGVFVSALVLLLPDEAFAQSGRRICGRWAQTATGYVGFLVDVENSSQTANLVCDKVRSIDQISYFYFVTFINQMQIPV
ncbi:MAG: hypothetical protein HQL77_17205 [Magnetococcales bacterium]|nr:hypothetical protein [Magnetococcales bacterium]